MLIGAGCDVLDGPLARRSGDPTDVGARADGVADLISFGVAPAVLLASSVPVRKTPAPAIAGGFYLAAAAWRVARYGIGKRTSHVFRGLPLTGAGIFFATACRAGLRSEALTYLALALGVAMVSPIRVLSGEALIRRALQQLGSR